MDRVLGVEVPAGAETAVTQATTLVHVEAVKQLLVLPTEAVNVDGDVGRTAVRLQTARTLYKNRGFIQNNGE